MTVSTKMQQTVASAESVMANLKSFALETQDQNAKQMFQSMAQSQQTIVDSLNARLQYIKECSPPSVLISTFVMNPVPVQAIPCAYHCRTINRIG